MAELRALAAAAAASADARARTGSARAQRRRPHEASFDWVRTQLRGMAAKVLPAGYFVSREDLPIMTTPRSGIASGTAMVKRLAAARSGSASIAPC